MKQEDIDHAIKVTSLKEGNSQDMRTRARVLTDGLDVNYKFVLERKQYMFRKGAGWVDNNPLELGSDVKLKDSISQKFIQFKAIIDHFNKTENMNLIKEYMDALDAAGIHITVDDPKDGFVCNNDLTIENIINELGEYQQLIDDENNELDFLSAKAEEEEYAPKSKFKPIIKLMYSKQIGKDVTKKIDKERKNIDLTSERLNDVEQ